LCAAFAILLGSHFLTPSALGAPGLVAKVANVPICRTITETHPDDAKCCCEPKGPGPLRWTWDWWFDSPITVFTALLVVIGLLGFIESRRANIAAQRAEQNTRTALVTSNRAYVWVRFTETAPPTVNQNTGVTVYLTVRNGGRTPAHRISNLVWVAIAPTSYSGNFPRPVQRPPNVTDLAPAAELKVMENLSGRILENEWLGLRNGTLSVFVYGQIDYADTFAIPRRTNFKYRINFADGREADIVLTADGNEAT
jgi:hypothetical protein